MKLGEKQVLTVVKFVDFGVYLGNDEGRGITLGHADAAALNQFDIDISKAQAPEARTWLLQNKAEFIALILGIEVVKVG